MNTTFPARIRSLLSDADIAGGATEELIASLEQRCALRLPEEYRSFLSQYGAALLPGFEVYGLVERGDPHDSPVWSDVRPLLNSAAYRRLPPGLVPISDDGGDYRFYLRCSEPDAGSISVYGPGRDGVIVSKGFFEFLERAATQGLGSML